MTAPARSGRVGGTCTGTWYFSLVYEEVLATSEAKYHRGLKPTSSGYTDLEELLMGEELGSTTEFSTTEWGFGRASKDQIRVVFTIHGY